MTSTPNMQTSTVTLDSIVTLRRTLKPLRENKTIALVPTMGNLHDGHLQLVKTARQHADIVVVSIFVNPTQFGINEDLDSYPRTLEADTQKLMAVGADYIFAPTVADMYPVMPPPTQVLAGEISQKCCGISRPTHFDGVGLVVSKLFNIVQPDVAIFGKKDYQQLAIIKQLVRDLSYDIDIIGVPIVRAVDGLALSSRNQYLTDEERQTAPVLHQQVSTLAKQLDQGEAGSITALQDLINKTIERINAAGFKVDYLNVLHQDLSSITAEDFDNTKPSIEGNSGNQATSNPKTNHKNDWVILTAAWLGKARLLDNQEVIVAND